VSETYQSNNSTTYDTDPKYQSARVKLRGLHVLTEKFEESTDPHQHQWATRSNPNGLSRLNFNLAFFAAVTGYIYRRKPLSGYVWYWYLLFVNINANMPLLWAWPLQEFDFWANAIRIDISGGPWPITITMPMQCDYRQQQTSTPHQTLEQCLPNT
jgi:hypothetical protein